jgi:hypothetical protein
MAKLHEEVVVLKLSKLVKENNTEEVYLANNEFCSSLEEVAQQLLGDAIMVEVVRT